MNIIYWLKPGLRIKRWIATGILGMTLIIFGITLMIDNALTIQIEKHYSILMIFIGVILTTIAVIRTTMNMINVIYYVGLHGKLENPKHINRIQDKNLLSRGVRVVVIGGGTGLSVLLRGIKEYTSNITAIVTVADDGGGSGKLREDLGMLPPGDIRNCILALANTEPIMERLLQYRFKDGVLSGQSFGNLLIAAMVGISDNFEDAIKRINDIFAVTGEVLPVTTEDITLFAKLKNEQVIKGESHIPIKSLEVKSPIEKVFIKPKKVRPLKEALDAILDADVVILGPGSLYTSIIPNLLVEDISKFIEESSALKVYVANVMTQPGETDGYSLSDHVRAIENHIDNDIIEYIYTNNKNIKDIFLDKYQKEGADPVFSNEKDRKYLKQKDIKIVADNFIEVKRGYVRHNAKKLAESIINMVINEKYSGDKIRFMELMSIMKKAKDSVKIYDNDIQG